MPLHLALLVVVAVAAFAVATYAFLVGRYRSEVIGRTLPASPSRTDSASLLLDLRGKKRGRATRGLLALAPASWADNDALRNKLVQAGYDGPTAVLTYTTVRLVTLVALPLAVAPFLVGQSTMILVMLALWSLFAGWAIPVWYVNMKVARRQEQIRRSVPDALDLLVVCIEAGVSLDAAILRVAREILRVHPMLATELLVVNRKTNAGVPRDQALRGLWERTGVEEVRALVSTMIQSDKWGTSIGTVLAVYAETLRRKRRQEVEKKAATVPLKMLFPLILFILPALFIVVMGPAALQIPKLFHMGVSP